MLPNFIIIGAQKAGSTFLQEAVEDHPESFVPRGELPFFEDPDYAPDRLPAFEKLFEPSQGRKHVGMKRPNYLGRPEVPGHIAAHVPDAKLLAVLRDPVDRVVSAYFHYLRGAWLPLLPLNQGIEQLLDGKLQTAYPRSHEVLDFGFYHRHLQHWLDYFSFDQFFIALYDEMKSDGPATIAQAYRFIGLDESYTPQTLDRRPMATTSSMVRLRFLRSFGPLISRKLDHGRRSAVRRNPGSRLLRKVVRGVDQVALSRLCKSEKPALSPDVRQRLSDLYHDDVKALEGLLSRSLSHWTPLKFGAAESAS